MSADAARNSTAKSRSDDGVERVRGHAVEAELASRGLAIERVAGPGERPGAERRDVRPAAAVGQPPAVALEHLDVGEQVVSEQDRLGRLEMGRPGQDRVTVALGQSNERPFEPDDRVVELVDRPPQPEAEVGRDLVVPRPAGVELAGERTDPGGERRLEVEVDVLERRVPGKRSGLDLGTEPVEPPDEGGDLVVRQQPGSSEPADVGQRTGQVVERERRIDLDRAGEVGDTRIVRLTEPPAPELHRPSRRVGRHRIRRASRGTVSREPAPVSGRPSSRRAGSGRATTARRRSAASSAVRSRCDSASSS